MVSSIVIFKLDKIFIVNSFDDDNNFLKSYMDGLTLNLTFRKAVPLASPSEAAVI